MVRKSLLAVLALALIGLVVAGCGGGSSKPKAPPAPSDAQQVQSQVAAFFASSGPSGCNFLSQTYIANNYGGSLQNCQSQLQSSQSEPIQTAQQVQITGPTTATSTFWTQFHHDQMSVVKSNGKWLMDNLTSLDKRDVHTVVNQWEGAVGSATCNYYSQGFLQRVYNGSLTDCQQKHANDQAAPSPTNQDISVTNDGHATDTFQSGDKTFQLHLILKGQTWQIDDVTQH